MRNRAAVVSLGLLVLLGVLIATGGIKDDTLTSLPRESSETSLFGGRPGVQSIAVTSRTDCDPLVPPIMVAELAGAAPISLKLAFNHGDRAMFHPHGDEVCASGCAASRHPTEKLSRDRFNSLLLEYATEPITVAESARDTLLYYGRQSSELLAAEGCTPLDPARAAILKYELVRDHAEIEIRVVDALDRIRASLPPTNVPLDRRHEFELDTQNLQPMIASGTVKRVGRDYLWTRL